MPNSTYSLDHLITRPFEYVTFGLTLGLSALAGLLNCAALVVLASRRIRERKSGMVTLSSLEILSNAALVAYLTCQLALQDTGPWQVGLAVHFLQMLRNNWLLGISLYRLAITVWPGLASRPHVQPTKRRQATLLAGVVLLSGGELFLTNAFSLLSPGGTANATNTTLNSAMEAETAAKEPMFKYLSYAILGVIVPGFCILVISAKIAHSLRSHFAYHPSSKRTSKIIALLAASFVLCQFPFAITYVVALAFLLGTETQSVNDAQLRWVHRFEMVANWGGVFQPIDSCLNFFILLMFSPSFRRILSCGGRHRNGGRRLRKREKPRRPPIVYRMQRPQRYCRYQPDEAGLPAWQMRLRPAELVELRQFDRPEDRYG